jgi:AraC family transcriptional regulator
MSVKSRETSTGNVRIAFLRCRAQTTVKWNVMRPEVSLIWARASVSESRVTLAGERVDEIRHGRANLWFLPEGVDAQGELTGAGAYDCAAVFVDPRFLPESARQSLTNPIIGFSHDALGRAFAELGGALATGDDMLPIFAEGWTKQALAHVARASQKSSAELTRRGRLAPWQLLRAKKMLGEDLSEHIPLVDVAQACRLSVGYFTHAFKISTCQTPHQWLTSLRIKTARGLLVNSHTPLVHIAGMCGFADQSHFTRVFTRTVGSSPGAWRRERLGQDGGEDRI